jgi:hypothetical protein
MTWGSTMKRILVAIIVVLAFSAVLWPAQTTEAAAKTVTVTVTEAQFNAAVGGRGMRIDLQEGRMVATLTTQSSGRAVRLIMVIRPMVKSGLVGLTVVSATMNGRAVPRTVITQANRSAEPTFRTAIARFAASYPGYRPTSVRFTRNTMRITLTQATR